MISVIIISLSLLVWLAWWPRWYGSAWANRLGKSTHGRLSHPYRWKKRLMELMLECKPKSHFILRNSNTIHMKVHPAAVRCDMVLHQACRARHLRKTGIGGEVWHGVASGVSCETSLNTYVRPLLHKEYRWRQHTPQVHGDDSELRKHTASHEGASWRQPSERAIHIYIYIYIYTFDIIYK